MYDGGKASFWYPYLLTLTLPMIFYVVPLKGDMCSTMVSVNDGEDLTALQETAFANFKSICRNSESTSVHDDATPCNGMFTTMDGNPKKRYPQTGFFNHPFERLEFSVRSTNNVFLDLKETNNNFIVIELGRTSRIETDQAGQSGHYINLSDVSRFWVTHINGKIQVGESGKEAPFMENNDSNMNVKYIVFDSEAVAEWLIYMPCNTA